MAVRRGISAPVRPAIRDDLDRQQRVSAGDDLVRIGDSGYDLGARARQIRNGLAALSSADEGAMLQLQLDDQAVFLARWRSQVLKQLTPEAVAGHRTGRNSGGWSRPAGPAAPVPIPPVTVSCGLIA